MVVLAIGRFASIVVRVARTRRGPFEAPLAHLLVGGFFLAQAAGIGLAVAAGADGTRLVSGYVVLLLVGWAGGVVVGHVGKLLSLSLWVWWPPGPRPKQAQLYPRRLGLVEAGVFALGVEAFAIGVFAGSARVAQSGAGLVCASAVLTAAGAVATWRGSRSASAELFPAGRRLIVPRARCAPAAASRDLSSPRDCCTARTGAAAACRHVAHAWRRPSLRARRRRPRSDAARRRC